MSHCQNPRGRLAAATPFERYEEVTGHLGSKAVEGAKVEKEAVRA